MLWAYGDMGTVITSHLPFAEGLCETGKGIEEPARVLSRCPGDKGSLQRHRAVTS